MDRLVINCYSQSRSNCTKGLLPMPVNNADDGLLDHHPVPHLRPDYHWCRRWMLQEWSLTCSSCGTLPTDQLTASAPRASGFKFALSIHMTDSPLPILTPLLLSLVHFPFLWCARCAVLLRFGATFQNENPSVTTITPWSVLMTGWGGVIQHGWPLLFLVVFSGRGNGLSHMLEKTRTCH